MGGRNEKYSKIKGAYSVEFFTSKFGKLLFSAPSSLYFSGVKKATSYP